MKLVYPAKNVLTTVFGAIKHIFSAPTYRFVMLSIKLANYDVQTKCRFVKAIL